MKTVYLDIETAPNLAVVWGIWQQNVAINQLLETGETMCMSYKWRDDDNVYFTRDLKDMWAVLNQADVVVTYNGDNFDLKTLNRDFLLAGIEPPDPYQSLDLLKVVRRRFRFVSNKLDFVCQELGIGRKVQHTGMELWLACMRNEPEAWEQMEEYNVMDTILLQELHDKLTPWIINGPHHGLHNRDGQCCPNCGSHNIIKKGFAYTNSSIFQRFKCKSCGTPIRSRLAEKETRPDYVSCR